MLCRNIARRVLTPIISRRCSILPLGSITNYSKKKKVDKKEALIVDSIPNPFADMFDEDENQKNYDSFNFDLVERDFCNAYEEGCKKLLSITVARATPTLFDDLVVALKEGGAYPMSHLAQTIRLDHSTLQIRVYEPSCTEQIAKAINHSKLDVIATIHDTVTILVPIPSFTKEYKENLVKNAKHIGEDTKKAIRTAEQKYIKLLNENKKHIPKDELYHIHKQINHLAAQVVAKLEKLLKEKKESLMQ